MTGSDLPPGLARFVSGRANPPPLFEVGKTYEIVMIIGGDENSMIRVVESYEHPLLKFADTTFEKDSLMMPGGGVVRGELINVTSPNFVSALLVEGRGDANLRIDLSEDDQKL